MLIALEGPLEIEAAAAADGETKGPRKFKIVAYNGGAMNLTGWYRPVVVDLKGVRVAAKSLPVLKDHDDTQVVGHTTELAVGENISAAGLISGVGSAAQEVAAAHDNGFPWRASIGAQPEKVIEVPEEVSVTANGRDFKGPLYLVKKSTLSEISILARGADRNTSVSIAATQGHQPKENGPMTFQQWVEALGLNAAELTNAQQTALQAKYDAEAAAIEATGGGNPPAGGSQGHPGIEPPEFDRDEIRAIASEHLDTIEAAAAEYDGLIEVKELTTIKADALKATRELKAKALKEKWLGPRFEVELIRAAYEHRTALIRAERPKGPAIHGSSRDLSLPAIEAAFGRSCGLASLEKHYKPEVLEASDRFRNLGLQELLLLCATQNGYAGRMRVGNDNLRDVIRAAFSTNQITTLLSTTGNKLLLEGFNLMPQSWREAAQVRSVTDFKSVTAFRLTASLEYEEVGPSGEMKHGTVSQESYSLQAKTHARMLALSRSDIINDDLGAFNDLRNRLGLGAAIKLNKVFWTAWLAAVNGAAFWTAARGNYQSGGATVLAEAGLNAAVKLFRDAAGPDGNLLGLEPDRLLVPSDLEATARKLYVSQEMRDTTASTKLPTSNIYFNRFRPVIVPELSSSAYTGYSPTHWFLLCNPAVLASAIVCFLNGQEAPTIESADADFNTLGIQFRGYHDFGCSVSEYRASLLSAGA